MWSDNETTQDLLGYKVHSDLLQKIVLDSNMLPISIGVFGNWGSGKSSLMLLMQEGIDAWKNEINQNHNKVLQIRFNSWQFESYDQTKLVMIETILEAVRNDISSNKKLFEKANDFLRRINLLKAGVFLLKKVYHNLPDGIKNWLPNKEEWENITGEDQYKDLIREVDKGNTSKLIENFRDLFEALIEEADYKAVIVYIDDLDRCDPQRIIECLEAVKLFVNVKRTAFVIGADERIIEYAIKQHDPIQQEKEEISSPFSDYLEKLIQLPYKIPRLSDNEQETYITLLLCKNVLDEDHFNEIHTKYLEFRKRDKYSKYDIQKIKDGSNGIDFQAVEEMLPIVPLMKQFLNGNPRQLKRFLNTLYIRKELADVAGFGSIRPDVLVKLMILEYNALYSSRFEDLYRIQRENDGILPIGDAEVQAKTREGIQDPLWKDNWSSDFLTKWMAFDPSLKDIDLQNYFWVARDALKNEKPIASLITNRINMIFKQLCAIQTLSSMMERLPAFLDDMDDEERDELILLINDQLRSDPDATSCWRIVNADDDNKLLDNVDRVKQLFNKVIISEISAQADTFFIRMIRRGGEIQEFIESLNLGTSLKNAIKIKNKK